MISSFGAFSSGKVSVIPNIKDAVLTKKFDNLQAKVLSSNFRWPNSVDIVSQDVFGTDETYIVVPDGFLPPGKTEGDIYVMGLKNGDVTTASSV